MNDSILNYEEKMWQLFDVSQQEMPDLANAYYGAVKDAVYKNGCLNIKTKRLMSLAVAIQAGCKDCMISQTSKALELGATPAEIFEVCSVVISMGGTLAWSKTLVVADYLREKEMIS
jgi:AhpD family alkylhydroperoxidase